MRRHRVLVALWLGTIVIFLAGWYLPVLSLVAQFSAFILAIMSVRRAEPTGELRRVWIYRGALGLLLAATATVVISAGSSVAFVDSSDHPVVGFIALATLNVITAVLAWRAIVKPAPRRAAIVGLIAVVAELFALIVDVIINLHTFHPSDFQVVAMIASFAATWAGALVCVAALLSFAPPSMYTVPDARVVDDN